MAITNFIPTVWSENLYSELDKKYIAVKNCNRDFEGDIKGKGAAVKICGIGNVSVSDYTKNSDMTAPETLSDTARTLTIDQAKYFNFQVDDIDKTQCSPKLLDAAMKNAAAALAKEADKYVYSLYDEACKISHSTLGSVDIMTILFDARDTLMCNGVSDPSDIIIELHPIIAKTLLLEKAEFVKDNSSIMETGYIGNFYGSKVYVSNNIELKMVNDVYYFHCYMRTKRAIAFAEQLSEIDAYRPEKRFADAVKGLHLYGAKVVRPNEFVCVAFNPG